MKLVARNKSEQNRAVFDPWTVVHFAMGLAAGLVEAPLRLTLPLAILYEVAENRLEEAEVGQELFDTRGPEVVPNAVVDVAFFVIGDRLGRLWNRTD